MTLIELYQQWCKETKRGGAVLIGGSIRDFFTWVEEKGYVLSLKERGITIKL